MNSSGFWKEYLPVLLDGGVRSVGLCGRRRVWLRRLQSKSERSLDSVAREAMAPPA